MAKAIAGKWDIAEYSTLIDGIYKIGVYAPEMAALCGPGQFLHVACGEGFSLRRPFSIFEVKDNMISFIFDVRGGGTSALACMTKGDKLDVLGPLGKGFTLSDTHQKVVIAGGGIGIYPLYELAKAYGEKALVFLGFRSKEHITLEEEFLKTGCTLKIATDDGSYGHKGVVTELLPDDGAGVDYIYACGPKAMLKVCANYAKTLNINGEISMEERMGCGTGACLVCACKVKKSDGSYDYERVCKDGPVFDIERVAFDD